jgi:hypothetical protein
MAKKTNPTPILLRWSQHVQLSEVQDPLGLGLRGSTRLASRLLHCITSITPRARYFSFIPWSVLDYQQREKPKSYGFGLRDSIILREKALTLACVAHHYGEACNGGALVGMREAGKWLAKGREEADFKRLRFAKVPALDAYFNSLVNLGFFVTEDEMEDTDEEDERPEINFDDIQLSPLGQQLAEAYGSQIGRLSSVRQLAERQRKCTVSSLAEWGKRGGLCELAEDSAPDRGLLRDVFFSLIDQRGESHPVRRHSLLLILELCRQLSADNWILNESAFAAAVYFGEIVAEEDRLVVEWPAPLADIATRWRMFYFHHFMSVALEGLFSWLISQVSDKGLSGATIEIMADGLDSATVRTALADQFGVKIKGKFGTTSPAGFFALFGITPGELTAEVSRHLDDTITQDNAIAEDRLEDLIRENRFRQSPAGLAVPMLLLALTLARYMHWQTTQYGDWLARAANDPYLDLIPPVMTDGLTRRFGDWWGCSWKELAGFVLSRYVVRQHIAMSYEKTAAGDRCLLQTDGEKVISSASYDKIGMGNPRFRSAVQILKDLALMEDTDAEITVLTDEGQQLLDAEVAKEAAK